MITALYCDGGVVWDGSAGASTIGGTWAYVAVESNIFINEGGIDSHAKYIRSASGFVPSQNGILVTNNHTEYIAVVKALESMEDGWSGVIYSDSLITLGRIFKGWRNKNLPQNVIDRKDAVLKRLGKLDYQHLDGHPTKAHLETGLGKRGNPVSKWNILADELCQKESNVVKGKITNDTSKSILQY